MAKMMATWTRLAQSSSGRIQERTKRKGQSSPMGVSHSIQRSPTGSQKKVPQKPAQKLMIHLKVTQANLKKPSEVKME